MIICNNDSFVINTKSTTYMMYVDKYKHLRHLYYGSPIPHDAVGLEWIEGPDDIFIGDGTYYREDAESCFLANQLLEYSSPGKGDTRESAIIAEYDDGQITFDFVYIDHELLRDGQGRDCLTIRLKDTIKPVFLSLTYKVCEEYDVITRSAKIENQMDEELTVRTFSSLMFDLPDADWQLVTLDGAWARECTTHRRKLEPGIITIDSKLGSSSCEHNPAMALVRVETDAFHGDAIGFNLIWSGNHQDRIEVSPFSKLRFLSSVNSFGFAWKLAKGEGFQSPEAVMTYSDRGLNKLSENMQRFVRNCVAYAPFAKEDRPILINSWEAVYFDISHEKIMSLAKTAAALGFELFVLDDGWFGRRTDDTRGLGDWDENFDRLPKGLKGLADEIHALGLKFGIWLEPEMVNEDSALFEQHPGWRMSIPGRTPSVGRHEYFLDLTRKEVSDYVYQSICKVLGNGVDYVKWDMNRNMSDYYCAGCDTSQLFVKYIQSLYSIIDRVREAFPGVLFEFCSSGGNRFDLGMVGRMDQGWASDNTDALSRVGIQQSLYQFYPTSVISCHVSDSPNHQTLRRSWLEDRFAVACFGVLGYELDLEALSEEERAVIARQVAFYKEHRRTFQHGLFRLLPSRSDNIRFWSIEGDDEIIVLETQVLNEVNTGTHDRLIIPFADEAATYSLKRRVPMLPADGIRPIAKDYSVLAKEEEEEIIVSGKILKTCGIALPAKFMGRGVRPGIRVMGDFGTDMYVVRKID